MDTNKSPSQDTAEDFTKIPTVWFKKQFPELFKKYHDPVQLLAMKTGEFFVNAITEDFLAETIGHLGNPKSPTVYYDEEGSFYRYSTDLGIFVAIAENQILAELSTLINRCATECDKQGYCDTSTLRYTLGTTARLNGVIRKAKGLLSVPTGYFDSNVQDYVACNNGMLRLADMELIPFSPEFRRRNKLAVPYDASAECPMFLNTLMRQALNDDDIGFLQKWFGLALLGKNLSQVIVILSGIAQGGKTTFVSIVTGVIGKGNVAMLRTEQLGERFETSSFLGKTLLYGPDVKGDFLINKNASVLKALVGNDPMTVELKHGHQRPQIIGNFNVVITANTKLNINLEGDAEAWGRRLAIIEYRKAKPKEIITSLAEIILKTEGSGVLNFALRGLSKLRSDDFVLTLTSEQKDVVNRALCESGSPVHFVKDCFVRDAMSLVTKEDCFEMYIKYCQERGWLPLPAAKANSIIEDQITRLFGITQRHDLKNAEGSAQRGWKGVMIKK